MGDPIGTTLSRYIHQCQRDIPGARGDLTELLDSIGLATRAVERAVRRAGLADVLGVTGTTNVQGEAVKKLDVLANDAMIACLDHIGRACILASEENDEPIPIPPEHPVGDYVVVFDPLDGSGNVDNNMPLGTIFGIYHRLSPSGTRGEMRDLLRRGDEQVAAGYVVHGSSTMLVLATELGVNGFTLDPTLGVWLLSHPDMQIPARGKTYSANTGNRAYWHRGVSEYVSALEAKDPARKRPYQHRYVGALVADVHRSLLEGGIFLYPADTKDPKKANGKLRMLYEAAPMAYVIERAGGAATDGRRRILEIPVESVHQRTPLFIGSCDDVAEATEHARRDG